MNVEEFIPEPTLQKAAFRDRTLVYQTNNRVILVLTKLTTVLFW